MKSQSTNRNIPWLAILLIIWNLFDIGVHVALDLIEPLRIVGNIAGLIAAAIVLLGLARAYTPHVLGLAAALVIAFNVAESIMHGFLVPSLIFIGVSVFLLVRWAQVELTKANPAESDEEATPLYLRWWTAIPITLVLVAAVALVGEQNELDLDSLTELHNGELVAADYWIDEPLIADPVMHLPVTVFI